MLKNGAVPEVQLVPVQSGNYPPTAGEIELLSDAAAAWIALRDDAQARFGVALTISSPGGGYRSLATQRDMRTNPAKYGAKVGKVAAVGSSVHGYGRCVDVWNWGAIGAYQFLLLARKHGFLTQTVAGETWHIEYPGGRADAPSGGGGGGGTTPKTNQEDEPMIVKYFNESDGRRNWIVWDNVTKQYDQYVSKSGSQADIDAAQKVANLWAGVSIQGNVASQGTAELFQWIVKTYTKGTFPFAPSSTSAPLPADVARKSDVEAIPAAVILEMKKPGN